MTSDLDIYRTANVLIRVHDAGAALEAAQHADAMLERGDMSGSWPPSSSGRSGGRMRRRTRPRRSGASLPARAGLFRRHRIATNSFCSLALRHVEAAASAGLFVAALGRLVRHWVVLHDLLGAFHGCLGHPHDLGGFCDGY